MCCLRLDGRVEREMEDWRMVTAGKAPPAGDKIDRHTPLGYYHYAVAYHAAADLIAEHGLKAFHPGAPALFLYYHAIELYLKAVLLIKRGSAKKLRKIGHEFGALRSRGRRRGLKLGKIERKTLRLMAQGDVWSRARYLKTGSIERPTLADTAITATTLQAWAADALKAAGKTIRRPRHSKAI
jgi:hypothetical protein